MKLEKKFKFALLLAVVVSMALGCMPKDPEERVAQLRSYYTARPIGFIVDARPVELVVMDMEAEGESQPAGEGPEVETPEGEGEGEDSRMAAVQVRQDVRLDILLQHDSPEKLPGVTLDIYMVDAAEVEIANWKLWVDTAELPKATQTQFSHLLEDIEYVEGHAFSVELRHPIPVEERSEYREFADATGG